MRTQVAVHEAGAIGAAFARAGGAGDADVRAITACHRTVT
jgi:hypothetical protein